jgi:hypothetical protein
LAEALHPGVMDGLGNVSQATILNFHAEYKEANDAVDEAVGERKNLRARIKGAGINLKAWDRMLKDAEKSGERREEEDRHYRYLMAALSKPVGVNGGGHGYEAANDPVDNRSPEEIVADQVARLKAIDAEGADAARRGDNASTNPWTPGTEEHARWHNAWMRDTETRAAAIKKPDIDPSKPRRAGRPRKSQQDLPH